jgi:hypothetical protein
MFGWGKKKKNNSDNKNEETTKIVQAFGKTLGEYDTSSSIHDVDKLPYDKKTIAEAIIYSISISEDKSQIELLKVGLLSLCSFQENIGESIAGQVDVTNLDMNLDPEELAKKYLESSKETNNEKYKELLVKAEEEYKIYLKQIK